MEYGGACTLQNGSLNKGMVCFRASETALFVSKHFLQWTESGWRRFVLEQSEIQYATEWSWLSTQQSFKWWTLDDTWGHVDCGYTVDMSVDCLPALRQGVVVYTSTSMDLQPGEAIQTFIICNKGQKQRMPLPPSYASHHPILLQWLSMKTLLSWFLFYSISLY